MSSLSVRRRLGEGIVLAELSIRARLKGWCSIRDDLLEWLYIA
ncbi:hypothetical protein SK066_09425 [Paenibacillus hunanensis]|nr:hypothetical protein [Paenibacillus hunanensis]WPP43134.1 hypothetical protein SK066_09425 [Paenibacillus hunanensis]